MSERAERRWMEVVNSLIWRASDNSGGWLQHQHHQLSVRETGTQMKYYSDISSSITTEKVLHISELTNMQWCGGMTEKWWNWRVNHSALFSEHLYFCILLISVIFGGKQSLNLQFFNPNITTASFNAQRNVKFQHLRYCNGVKWTVVFLSFCRAANRRVENGNAFKKKTCP